MNKIWTSKAEKLKKEGIAYVLAQETILYWKNAIYFSDLNNKYTVISAEGRRNQS